MHSNSLHLIDYVNYSNLNVVELKFNILHVIKLYTSGTDGLLETLCCVFFILNLTEQNKRQSNFSVFHSIRTKCRTANTLNQLPLNPTQIKYNITERVLNYLYANEEV